MILTIILLVIFLMCAHAMDEQHALAKEEEELERRTKQNLWEHRFHARIEGRDSSY